MINDKEKLKIELNEKIKKEIDTYVEKMDKGFQRESFSIDKIIRSPKTSSI